MMHSSTHASPRVGSLGADPTIPPLLDFYITAHYDIPKGAELFTDYGGELWFAEKGIPYLAATHDADAYNREDMEGGDAEGEGEDQGILLPGCPSGKVEITGGKVYATQVIQPGEVVEVARYV
jgi:hypothetical protein